MPQLAILFRAYYLISIKIDKLIIAERGNPGDTLSYLTLALYPFSMNPLILLKTNRVF